MRGTFENMTFAIPVTLGKAVGREQTLTEGDNTHLKLSVEYMEYTAAYTYAVEISNTESDDEILIKHAEKELISHKVYSFSTVLKSHVESVHLSWDDNDLYYCVEIITTDNRIYINFGELPLAMEVYNAIAGWLLFKEF